MVAVAFRKGGRLEDFQRLIESIYSLPDDRLYSIYDLLAQQQRFTTRALKGIRKKDQDKIKVNLAIALAWCMAVANRLHINIEQEVVKLFREACPYCGRKPCTCKAIKRASVKPKNKVTANKNIDQLQKMFAEIYPPTARTIQDAGIHVAEEMGEVSEAIHNFLGQHSTVSFSEIQTEIADYVSCLFGLANSVPIDVTDILAELFYKNCHVCHKAPCICSYSSVSRLST